MSFTRDNRVFYSRSLMIASVRCERGIVEDYVEAFLKVPANTKNDQLRTVLRHSRYPVGQHNTEEQFTTGQWRAQVIYLVLPSLDQISPHAALAISLHADELSLHQSCKPKLQ